MCAQWNNKYRPDLLLKKLQATRNAGEEPSFSTVYFEELVEVLLSSIKFDSALPRTILRGIVFQSIFHVAKFKSLSKHSLLREISKRENEYEQQPFKKFYLAGTISLRSREVISPVQARHCAISFGSDVPRAILENEVKYKRIFQQAVCPIFPKEYTRFVVSSQARSIHEAGQSCLEYLDYYRALWNLCINRITINRSSSGRISPINQIVLGPLNTLFTEDLVLVEDTWWEDHNYDKPEKVYDGTDDWKTLREFESKAVGKIRADETGELIRECLKLYVNALDIRDYESSFLKLWCALERLTQIGEGSYDETIDRASSSSLWPDSDYHGRVLYHLKQSRNMFVHRNKLHEGEVLVFQLKRYVEELIEFYIFQTDGLGSPEEIMKHLAAPKNKQTFVRRVIEFLKFPRKFIGLIGR